MCLLWWKNLCVCWPYIVVLVSLLVPHERKLTPVGLFSLQEHFRNQVLRKWVAFVRHFVLLDSFSIVLKNFDVFDSKYTFELYIVNVGSIIVFLICIWRRFVVVCTYQVSDYLLYVFGLDWDECGIWTKEDNILARHCSQIRPSSGRIQGQICRGKRKILGYGHWPQSGQYRGFQPLWSWPLPPIRPRIRPDSDVRGGRGSDTRPIHHLADLTRTLRVSHFLTLTAPHISGYPIIEYPLR